MQDFLVDAFAFCRLDELRNAETAISDLPRLLAECAENTHGTISWSVQGSVDKNGRPRLVLVVKGTMQLQCQRCLSPMAFHLDSQVKLMLAKDEDHADELEALLEDDGIDDVDVVVGSKSFNLLDLVEDEALLAIPQSPKHEVCPEMTDAIRSVISAGSTESGQAAVDADAKQAKSPFAVLKK